jgi:dsRNA-specific ribonuclease
MDPVMKIEYIQLYLYIKNKSIVMESFKALIKSLIIKGQLAPKYNDVLLNNIALYQQAFTSESYDEEVNYEMYEQLGDSTANKFLVWYFYRRFPQLANPKGVKIVARLKTNYSSKNSFAKIAENLGFWKFIRASEQKKETDKKSLLEDVFEAFVGVTETILDNYFQIGVGYVIVQRILTDIFDKIDISLRYEDLYDSKTRLKELFDINKQLGTLIYEYKPKEATVYRQKDNRKIFLATGHGNIKSEAQQSAAQKALDILAKEGFTRVVDYSMFYQ